MKRIRILSFGKIIKILNLKYNSCLYSKINVFPWRQDVPGPKDTTIQGISPSPRHRPGGQRRGGGGEGGGGHAEVTTRKRSGTFVTFLSRRAFYFHPTSARPLITPPHPLPTQPRLLIGTVVTRIWLAPSCYFINTTVQHK